MRITRQESRDPYDESRDRDEESRDRNDVNPGFIREPAIFSRRNVLKTVLTLMMELGRGSEEMGLGPITENVPSVNLLRHFRAS